jgi:ribonuclease E
MKKEMLINVKQPEECRIAIVEDGILEELYVERTSHESYTGNIYKGRIVNLEPAIQAAFVDFSVGRNGFLHVSDIESQYFERGGTGTDEADPAAPRERERRRDPRREGDRNRGRDPRRRPPGPDPIDPLFGPPPGDPLRSEGIDEHSRDRDRSRDRPFGPPPLDPPRIEEIDERSRDRDRDRNRDRPRERERPDLSIKGRRDRSEMKPRRFGEGLISQPEPWPEPESEPPAELVSLEPEPPVAEHVPQPPVETPETRTAGWPEPSADWSEERPAETAAAEHKAKWAPDLAFPPEPEETSLTEAELTARELLEPYDPDLPPSRTHRNRPAPSPAELADPEWGRSRAETPEEPEWPERRTGDLPDDPSFGRRSRRGRGQGRTSGPPPRSQQGFSPEREPSRDPQFPTDFEPEGPAFPDDLRNDQPPRRRGGRAAIRSRGADPDRPRDPLPHTDPRTSYPHSRSQPAPGVYESDRGRSRPPERRSEPERRRASGPPEPARGRDRERDRDRDRKPPHSRAGEPGYVPRRERLRSGDLGFGADIFPPESDWPDRDVEPDLANEIRPRTGNLAEDDAGPGLDAGTAGLSGEARTDRGRRRRRGRRRERERPGYESVPRSPAEDVAPGFEDLPTGADSAWAFDRDRAPVDEDFDDFDEIEPPQARRQSRGPLDEEDFGGDEPGAERTAAVDDQIDAELEQEIQREIDEIAELEREMGLRGPAEARTRRGDQPPRGGRSVRGRGLAKPPIQEIFRRGDEVLVQVIKESIGTKGPTLSTYISIPGRYLVLMPGLNRVGVSRKIIDEGQRRKLREIMNELNPPKGLGFIVRTAGLERTKRELARDLAYLLRLWKVILRRIKKSKAPTPIYQESDMIIRTIRDIFNSEIDTIWIDEPSAFERAQDFLKVVMPRFVNRLKLYDEKVPLFHKYGIEDEIAKIQRRHVPLPEGGSIVIDQTEALVAIDVNSGNFRVEDDAERTAYEMNLRAAKEIARQLRLRDLGGVIVNDFIDMREERHRRGVERALRDAIKRDRARTKVLRMSAFGLIEMTRQRIRPSLKRSIYEDCPHCGGAGVAKTAESMAIDVMRLLALASHREEIRRISVSVHPSVATYLGNRKRQQLAKLEADSNMSIQIAFDENAAAEHLKIECHDANGNEIRPFPSVGPGHKRGH